MKAIAKLLMKVFVQRFYIANAGFLLFLFFIFFGIVYGGQLIAYHRSLILAMITSPVFMAVVWLAWLLYNIKCMLFCNAAIRAGDGNYIYALRAVPPAKQFVLYLLISTLQFMPVLAYAWFVIYIAAEMRMALTAISVAGYCMLMVVSGAGMTFITINRNGIAPALEKLMAALSRLMPIKPGYNGLLLSHIFNARKIVLAIVKIFSLLLLSVSFIRNGDQFDEDLFGIFLQVIFVAHALLVFYCVGFAETQLQFSRNLPIRLYRIALSYFFTYCLVMLPELGFMLINNHGNLPVSAILLLYGTAVSILFLYTAVLYSCGLNMESYLLLVFVIFVMVFFLQKTGLQLMVMLGILLTAASVFKQAYYSFEQE